MSEESKKIADRVLDAWLPRSEDIWVGLRNDIAHALEASWNQGYEDAKMAARLDKMGSPLAKVLDGESLHLQDLSR